jgi:hypothetical protein
MSAQVVRGQPIPKLAMGFESGAFLFQGPGQVHGGHFVSDSTNFIDGYLEALEFAPSGIQGAQIGRILSQTPFNHYLSVVPVSNRRGLIFQLPGGAIFDLLSVDVANYTATRFGEPLQRLPTKIQFYPGSNPPTYITGIGANGWQLVERPQPAPTAPLLETIPIAESTAATFPAHIFRGIRRAYLGLDAAVGLDNFRVNWSRDNFANGARVTLLDQSLAGQQIDSDGLTTFHRPFVESAGAMGLMEMVTEDRRIFSWERPETTMTDLPLSIAGEFDFMLFAENGGRATIQWEVELKNLESGTSVGSMSGLLGTLPFSASPSSQRSFDDMFGRTDPQ